MLVGGADDAPSNNFGRCDFQRSELLDQHARGDGSDNDKMRPAARRYRAVSAVNAAAARR